MPCLGNIRHSDIQAKNSEVENTPEVVEGEGEEWCARRDSNSRPIAPEDLLHKKSTT
jgi:hypothetical protein